VKHRQVERQHHHHKRAEGDPMPGFDVQGQFSFAPKAGIIEMAESEFSSVGNGLCAVPLGEWMYLLALPERHAGRSL